MRLTSQRLSLIALTVICQMVNGPVISAQESIELVGGYPGGDVAAIRLVDGIAFIALERWFEVAVVTEANLLELQGWVRIPEDVDYILDLEVSESLAFIAGREGGLLIIDAEDPTSPAVIGQSPILDQAYGLFVDGNHVYVVNSDGLHIFDVSVPSSPTRVGNASVGIGAESDVAVVDGYAYIAGSSNKLVVVDVADVTSPLVVNQVDTPGYSKDIVANGSHVFVADSHVGVIAFDVSDPTSPIEVGRIATPNTPLNLEYSSEIVMVRDKVEGARFVDVSTPSALIEIGAFNPAPGYYNIRAIALSDERALVGWRSDWHQRDVEGRISLIDVSSSHDPVELGSFDQPDANAGIEIWGDILAVVDHPRGLRLFERTNPTQPTPISLFESKRALNVAFSGSTAVLAGDDGLFQTVDVSDSLAPTELGRVDGMWQHPVQLRVSGAVAYVLTSYRGLYIIDIHDPSTPTIVANIDATFGASWDVGFEVRDTFVFLVDFFHGLRIIDTVDSSNPVVIATYSTTSPANYVVLSDSFAIVTCNGSELYLPTFDIFDVSDPYDPILVEAQLFTISFARSEMRVQSGFSFMTGSVMKVFDLSHPAEYLEVGFTYTDRYTRRTAASGKHFYVTSSGSGLEVWKNHWIFTNSFESGTISAWSEGAE